MNDVNIASESGVRIVDRENTISIERNVINERRAEPWPTDPVVQRMWAIEIVARSFGTISMSIPEAEVILAYVNHGTIPVAEVAS